MVPELVPDLVADLVPHLVPDLVPDSILDSVPYLVNIISGTRSGDRFGIRSGTRFGTRSGTISGIYQICYQMWYLMWDHIHINKLIPEASRPTGWGGLGGRMPPQINSSFPRAGAVHSSRRGCLLSASSRRQAVKISQFPEFENPQMPFPQIS